MFYNWHRYYVPELGRYNRVDDLGLLDGLNPFIYAGLNPLLSTDPSGLFSSSMGIGGNIPLSPQLLGVGFDVGGTEIECCDEKTQTIFKNRYFYYEFGPSWGMKARAGYSASFNVFSPKKPSCQNLTPSPIRVNLPFVSVTEGMIDIGMHIGLSMRWNMLRGYKLFDRYDTGQSCCSGGG